eukprot:CAMPEP_0115856504 /NCGR_PEP_ID=MMETSP0287-20121206/15090_1 /TAXON_ID=412157 /ORGANISM="Chrysochromulina rotalis, Strain UIO044" /LENGTH=92 /DNA_ID=CAMNT_0003310687 /DNA_START=586 /DNA_END=865 /DNA_ORIENTATION=+
MRSPGDDAESPQGHKGLVSSLAPSSEGKAPDMPPALEVDPRTAPFIAWMISSSDPNLADSRLASPPSDSPPLLMPRARPSLSASPAAPPPPL